MNIIKQDIFIFGALKAGENCLNNLNSKCFLYNVLGFIDNDNNKVGSKLEGVNIYGPNHLLKYDKNIKIIIASSYFEQISQQLENMGYTNYIGANGEDKWFKGTLYEFVEFTKKTIYAKTLKISSNWMDNISKSEKELNLKISEKVLNLYQEMSNEQIKDIYKPGFLWETAINKNLYDLYGAMKRNNIEVFNKLIFEFRQYGTVLGIADEDDALRFLQQSFSDKKFIEDIVGAYEYLTDIIEDKILKNLDESEIGNPLCINYKKRRLTTEVIRHAYYVERVKEYMKHIDFEKDNKKIFIELGGGTGDTARQMKKYFGEKIVYVILDLPEVLTISSYYLMRNFTELKIGTYDDFSEKSTIEYNDLIEYDIILLPNYFIERFEDNIADVFINTASLGEMETNIAENYLKQISKKCNKLFYSNNRDEMKFQINGEYRGVGINNIILGQNWDVISDINNIKIYKAIKGFYREKLFLKVNNE